jgi:uncharacterized protein (DUF2252 family)
MTNVRQQAPGSVRGHVTSPDARRDAGRARRKDVPLESHAELCPDADRDDPLDLLAAQDTTRVPDLVPIRYGRMSRTAFTFLRGAAAVMASDLSKGPSTDLTAQLCGDAHVSNFGIFNSPDRRLVFDVNDFDETLPGPFEWDLKRLVASVIVCARQNGISEKKGRSAARAAVKGFRETIDRVAGMDPLAVHYHRIEVDNLQEQMKAGAKKDAEKLTKKASKKNSLRALRKLTDIVDGRRVIVADPPLVVPFRDNDAAELAELRGFFDRYRATLPDNRRRLLRHYSVVDVAYKMVGVGSVGTRACIVLLESGAGDPLFLQFKEAGDSVLAPYLPPSEYDQAGQRVVEGQRLIQATGDIFLGWSRWTGSDAGPLEGRSDDRSHIDFYFRQLWDGKGSMDVDNIGPERLKSYARACGAALALAQARSGDAAMIAGYVGDDTTLDHALADFACDYADRNDTDHQQMEAAIADGSIPVVTDI